MLKIQTSFPWEDLLQWYKKYGRHMLPWRKYDIHPTERLYRVWLSEILLQQTQVDRVIPYFENILTQHPTIQSLAQTSYEDFFGLYKGLGYYSRARNILKTAKKVSEEYAGIFPEEKSSLIQLPGVGEYTSHAILAFGYGKAYLAWDTNLEKVFSRYIHGSRYDRLTDEEKTQVEKTFQEFILLPGRKEREEQIIRDLNNALMDFASLVDIKNTENIDWESYPIKSGVFYVSRGSSEPKERKKSTTFPTPDAEIFVVLHKDHKIYYSDPRSNGYYSPFILSPPLHRDTRKYVQGFFREKYGLQLSVRPPQKKWFSSDGKPYILVNAQIQAGVYPFIEYSKSAHKKEIEKLTQS